MLPSVRGLLIPLSTLMLFSITAPAEPPLELASTLIPAVTLWYTLLPTNVCRGESRLSMPWSPLLRLSRALRGSSGEQGAVAEQVEAGAAVHLPLQQLEAGDLTLGLAVAPGRGERGADRGSVLLQPRRG